MQSQETPCGWAFKAHDPFEKSVIKGHVDCGDKK